MRSNREERGTRSDFEPGSLFAANTVSLHRGTLFKALFNRMKGGSETGHFLFRLGPVPSAEIEETTLRRIHPFRLMFA